MRWYVKLVLPIILIFLWEVLAILINNEFILPHVGSVVEVLITPFADIFGQGSLGENSVMSLYRVLIGFGIGLAVAIPLGIFMGRFSAIDEFVDPVIQLLRPIPPIAWLPLALAWFKIGLTGIVFIIFIGAFFPVLINTIDGVRRVNKTWLETAYTFGSKEMQILTKVIIPASMPTIWTGLRVGFGIAWMSVVAAEMLPGTTSGLGYLILFGLNIGQLQVTIAGMIMIGLIGLSIDYFLKRFEQRHFKWKGLER
ncbi:MAG TPA: ABC transporter permease [Methanoregulaceae archaeon]|nr:ABC transporter permease [Methanoregulaceae archaeon]